VAERYWLIVGVFHAGLLAWVAGLLRLAARRIRSATRPWAELVVGIALFLAVALFWALVLLPFAPSRRFMLIGLVCQAVFGEGVLLSAATAWMMSRAERKGPARVATGLLLALLATYGYAYHFEPFNLRVRTHSVALADTRRSASTLRILHLSDIQAARVGAHEERAIRLGLEQRPDLIVFTGDLAQSDPWGSRGARPRLRELLRQAADRAPLGAYAVQGDVDHDWPATLEGSGFVPLSDSSVAVRLPDGHRVALVGLGLRNSRTRSVETLAGLLGSAPPADARIVLGHSPDFALALSQLPGVDLALAGHTHGGQVVVPFLGPPLTLSRIPRRQAAGLSRLDHLWLHVSPGIGLERGAAPPIRFLCPPAVCLLELSL